MKRKFLEKKSKETFCSYKIRHKNVQNSDVKLYYKEPMRHYVKYKFSKLERQKEMIIKHRLTSLSSATHPPPMPFLPITSLMHYKMVLNSMSLFDCEKTDKNKYFRGVQINFNPKS